jgi:D-aminopeptidase
VKIFISADIEGIAGITSWDEADPQKSREVREFAQGIETVATSYGHGSSTVSIHPELARERIREGMRRACTRTAEQRQQLIKPPRGPFHVEVTYNRPRTRTRTRSIRAPRCSRNWL